MVLARSLAASLRHTNGILVTNPGERPGAPAQTVEAVLPLAEERLTVEKHTVARDRVRIRTVVDEREHLLREQLECQDAQITRVAVGRELDSPPPPVRQEGDTLILPILEEIVVVEKRWLLKEELHVRVQRHSEPLEHPIKLKAMRAVIERDRPSGVGIQSPINTNMEDTVMPNRTITALFDSRAHAEQARQRLVSANLSQDDIRIMDQDSGTLGRTQADTEGFWQKLKHLFVPEDDRYVYEEGMRGGGALLSVRVDEAETDMAIATLEQCNPVDIEKRSAELRQAGRTAPASGDQSAQGEEVLPIAEERLRVGKREVQQGSVRVRSYVVEQPAEESVRLREERVQVERQPVGQESSMRAGADPFKERVVEMQETGEEPVVQKDTIVTEQVTLRKHAQERTENVKDTVRRTEVEIEKSPNAGDRNRGSGNTSRPR